jgi:glycerol-3-phosphate acyltransferase PlsY
MDIFLINILCVIFCLALGYFFGSIPTAVWVGKIFFHQDPRDYGSKNAGGTNAGRLWGKKVGFVIILIDMFKTVVPMYICWLLLTFIPFNYAGISGGFTEGFHGLMPTALDFYTESAKDFAIQWPMYWLAILGVAGGHIFPVFANFKGGKAVSCFMGTTVAATWMLGFIPGFVYFGALKATKYVSVTAVIITLFDTTITWIWVILAMTGVIPHHLHALPMYGPGLLPDLTYAIVITALTIIVIIRHIPNYKRLAAGTEPKIKWMK